MFLGSHYHKCRKDLSYKESPLPSSGHMREGAGWGGGGFLIFVWGLTYTKIHQTSRKFRRGTRDSIIEGKISHMKKKEVCHLRKPEEQRSPSLSVRDLKTTVEKSINNINFNLNVKWVE